MRVAGRSLTPGALSGLHLRFVPTYGEFCFSRKAEVREPAPALAGDSRVTADLCVAEIAGAGGRKYVRSAPGTYPSKGFHVGVELPLRKNAPVLGEGSPGAEPNHLAVVDLGAETPPELAGAHLLKARQRPRGYPVPHHPAVNRIGVAGTRAVEGAAVGAEPVEVARSLAGLGPGAVAAVRRPRDARVEGEGEYRQDRETYPEPSSAVYVPPPSLSLRVSGMCILSPERSLRKHSRPPDCRDR